MEKAIILVGIVLVILGVGLVVSGVQHHHNEDCKWIAPLQTQYVMCSDGKVRLK